MRITVVSLLILLLGCSALFSLGCSQAPPCTVSPIEIEETREDEKVLEKDLNDASGRAQQLQARLNEKQSELDKKKKIPPELRKKVDELKKGSGRSEEQKKYKKKDEKE